MKTTYQNWLNGTLTGLGSFQELIFKAYQRADLENCEKLKKAFPNWFTN